ncbi:hypothetical protein H4R21_000645 [Coemansia helicoidea]|uniref:Uncharacterized protein n=1 Tax=Coemansia helicoidea TaxID=1286919 RepID=A0ACC1LED0_9FUNG|nr:hypothetical protein H4R21_000645 [Coemansia helicoidea]
MSLVNAPANHSWASFSTDTDSQEIEFTNLKYLFAGYHITHREDGVAARHRDGHPWKLHFPSLESLDLKCSEDICPLLEYAVLPPSVEAISIQMKSATYLDIANVELPATKHLSLRVTFTCDGDPSGLPVVNRILERARGSETVGLVIEDEMLQVLPESITSTALTHLRIWSTISVDTMLALIGKLPSLVLLSAGIFDPSDIQADISIPDADEDTAVEPLSLSLKHLIMSNGRSGHSPDMAVAVVKYVLLKLPTLAVLSSRQTPRTQVLDFVKERLPRYPHLGAVKLILDE